MARTTDHAATAGRAVTPGETLEPSGTDPVPSEPAVETPGPDRRFRTLLDRSSDVLVLIDPDGRVKWVSPAVETMLGYPPVSVVGMPSTAFLTRPDVVVAADRLAHIRRGDVPDQPLVVRARDADGAVRHLRIVISDLSDDPDVEGLLLHVADVSDEVSARRSRDRLSAALELSPDLVCVIAVSGQVWMNSACSNTLGLPPGDDIDIDLLAARTPTWVRRRIDDEVAPAIVGTGSWEGELAVLDTEGEVVPLSVVVVGLEDDGELDTVTVMARDISERKAFEARLEHQATHDPLTGLPNRTLLLDRLRVAVDRAARQHTVVAVLFLDLDNFKTVNDGLGHSAGDRLLREVSARIEAALRPGDTVARFGGDEFAVLCQGLSDRTEAVAVARRIEDAVARPIDLDGTDVTVTVSIGVATSDGTDGAEGLFRDSDAAMYQAKARGRSRTEMFDAAMHVQAVERLELEAGLRRALERHEMRVVFQPQVDLRTGRINGVECLARWEHPERGILGPGEFLPIAEETGLIVPIGSWVLATAARTLTRLRLLHPDAAESLVMSINISARQLASPRLVEDAAAIVAETQMPPGSLMLEITESDLMDVERATRALAELQALGIRVSVDDFGTGWSSLRYLRQFPVDVLKIDRSFVSGLGREGDDEVIVAAVIDLAHSLGLSAVAEGVETDLHVERLRELGCDSAQGWRLGSPMTESDLLDVIARGNHPALRPVVGLA